MKTRSKQIKKLEQFGLIFATDETDMTAKIIKNTYPCRQNTDEIKTNH